MLKFKSKSLGMAMKNLIKSLSRHINKMKIKKQLLMIYLVAVMIPILLLGSYLVYNTRNVVLQQQISETRAENIKVENSIKQLTDVAANISSTIYFDSDLRNIISHKYSDERIFINLADDYTKFGTITQNYSEIKSIEIYSENKTIYDSLHFRKVTPDIRKTSWYTAASQSWRIVWAPAIAADGEEYLSLVRQIPTNVKGEKAVLVLHIDKYYLSSLIADDPLKTIAAVENGSIIMSSDYDDLGKAIGYYVPAGSRQDVRTIMLNNTNVLAALDAIQPNTSDTSFSVLTINYNALKRAYDVTWICCIILLISLIVPFLMILYFSDVFSSRIDMLRSEMNNVAKGELELPSNPGGNDEISELYNDLNVMIDGIKKLLNEVYMEKLIKERMVNSQQKIEFKMLASQINPHFLYNTLETIRMKLICSGDRETANVIKILGKTMRRILEVKDEVVTLDSELEYIRYYLEIQRFRFGSRIEYEINVDDSVDAKEFYILPLLLQPIVENAFVHGLEDKTGGGKITLDICKMERTIQITVEDNGIGMSQEKCDILNKSIRSAESRSDNNSIGLCNVHQRITLYYGQGYGLNITSKLDFGTKVLISLPSDMGVMTDYEGTDNR